jgi:hypothetical protein
VAVAGGGYEERIQVRSLADVVLMSFNTSQRGHFEAKQGNIADPDSDVRSSNELRPVPVWAVND